MNQTKTIDQIDDQAALRLMLDIQLRAVSAVGDALGSIGMAAQALAEALSNGHRLIYVGAGSSGLIAIQDGAELPGTFGIDPKRIVFLTAGGIDAVHNLIGGVEDDTETAQYEIQALGPLVGDIVIALSASGSTPYTVAAAKAAKASGALIIGIANNAPSPLLELADIAIAVLSGPEAVEGSTRMAAGTAQKCVLGLLSTLANTRLGHVYQGLMVNVRADNAKLQRRAEAIVARIAGVDHTQARQALAACEQDVKAAILLASGAASVDVAHSLIALEKGQLKNAIRRLKSSAKL
jgi:N-acetylmuramic acid 6-phosphate etherase